MEQDNIESLTKALERLRNYPEFHEVIADLRSRRDSFFDELARSDMTDGNQRQLIGVMTAYDEIANHLEGN